MVPLFVLFAAGAFLMNAQTHADLVVLNAHVAAFDAGGHHAQALAVRGNRISLVGSTAEARAEIGPQTRVIDAGGRLVIPGFNDAHVHFLQGGFQLSSVDLRTASSREEFANRIRQFAASRPKGRWITGGDWDHELWAGAPLPERSWIDASTPETPVFVSRLDGHMALANSLALRLAGITRETKDPPGGLVVRAPTSGEPTGVLKDAAMNLVYRVIPESTFEEKLEAARAASRYAASLGVTSVQDVSAGTDIGVYQTLAARGELLTRIYAVWPLPEWERLGRTGIRRGFGNPMLRIGGLKGFADGSLGSTTALFFDAYADAPHTAGLPADQMIPPESMYRRIQGADKAGLQVMIHAIGDRANDEILTMFERVSAENGQRDRRFRIEHAQHLRERDIPRFALLGVIPSMQPYHAADDGRWATKRIGSDRTQTTYAFRSLLDAGAKLAFGSDWTVAPLDPLLGLRAAVTRQTIDGKNPDGWVPKQKISVEEAIRAYTMGSAYAEFEEKEKGSLEPGKLADFVMLSRDVLKDGLGAEGNLKVLLTVTDGRVVYEKK